MEALDVNGLAAYAEERGIKRFEVSHVIGSAVMVLTAAKYAQDYNGDFEYMLSMKLRAQSGKGYSPAMARGILNCMLAEHKRSTQPNKRSTQPKESAQLMILDVLPEPGTYTVGSDATGHVTLRIVKWKTTALIVERLVGPDNETDFKGVATISTTTREYHPWRNATQRDKDAVAILGMADADLAAYGYSYALRSGRCYRCGRKLTVPASIHRGLGPVCAQKDA